MKQIFIIAFYLGFTLTLHSQEDTLMDSFANNFAKQLLVFPQEKLYLHTDKPYYITGEKIFFRAFLLDAFSNRQDTLSRYVYVELINPVDSVVQRVKIRRDSTNMFYGAIPLPEDLAQGAYKIRAYTRYMQNQGESSFFSKHIRISDPQVLKVQTQTDFQFAENGKINASLRFVDAKTQEVIKPQAVSLRLNQDPVSTQKPNNDGWVRVQLKVPDKESKRILYVELANDSNVFKQYIPIPYPEGDFDVSFYPEGGHLVAGQLSNVAFKALDAHGTPLDITGEITDFQGNRIAELKTVHDGMGDFYIIPLPEEHYQAVIQVKGKGKEEVKGKGYKVKEISLPETQTNAFALKILSRNEKFWIGVNRNASTPCPALYLLIHSGGLVVYSEPWDASKEFIAFNKSLFPSGISHVLLLTKDLQVVSERLIFLLNNDQGLAELKTQKETYRKRELVQTEIHLKDAEQQTLVGNFLIAVTNDKEVVLDTTSGFLSNILLSSELRGHIDNPEYYFQRGNKQAEQVADLLMKTNGWTRYAIPDVIRGKIIYPQIPFEQSQEISGIVKSGLFSKPVKGFQVSLISLNQGFFDTAETDRNGRYVFKDFELPDSTIYTVQALNSKNKGKETTELYVDEDTFPKLRSVWTEPLVQKQESNPVLLDYVTKADLYYTYENGKRIVHLPEIQVKGIKKQDEYKSMLYTDPDLSLSGDEITKYGTTNTLDLLRRMGVTVVEKDSNGYITVSNRGVYGSPLIVIDDIPYEPLEGESVIDVIKRVNFYDIAKIDVLKRVAPIFGSRGGSGVIAIFTKKGERGRSPLPSFNIKQAKPLGFQLPVEFYSPKYDTQEKIDNPQPDLRTTIYWKPNVLTDSEGNAKLDFYTADDPGTYSVIIEGVSEDGKLIHYYGKAAITVNSDK